MEAKLTSGYLNLNLTLSQEPGICLSMIVKNEAHVIEQALNSIKELVDYVVVVDTGSTDTTPEVIEDWLLQNDVPGRVVRSSWYGFAGSRNEALREAAKHKSHALILDADDYLVCEGNVTPNDVGKKLRQMVSETRDAKNVRGVDMLLGTTVLNTLRFCRPFLVRNNGIYKWKGRVHESLYPTKLMPKGYQEVRMVMADCHIGTKFEGARSKEGFRAKYAKDATEIVAEMAEKRAARMLFYLAQSYRDSEQSEKALPFYVARGRLTDTDVDQRYYALIQAAWIQNNVLHNVAEAKKLYKEAYEVLKRPEAAYWMSVLSEKDGLFHEALTWAKIAHFQCSYQPNAFCADIKLKNEWVPNMVNWLTGLCRPEKNTQDNATHATPGTKKCKKKKSKRSLVAKGLGPKQVGATAVTAPPTKA
jgi:glycosyltransferase involved in cell wall biosynthesis